MRSARIPQEKVARFSAHFYPLAVVIFEPLHTPIGKTVPFRGPGRDSGLVFHLLVEFLAKEVRAFADDETTVVWSVRVQVDKTLKAAKTRLLRVLEIYLEEKIFEITSTDIPGPGEATGYWA